MLKSRFFRITMPLTRIFVLSLGLALCTPSHAQMLTDAQVAHARKAKVRFRSLWQQRGQRKIARFLVPFVNDPIPHVQYDAIRMLGRLEDPVALPALQKLAKAPMYMPSLDAKASQNLVGIYPLVPLAIGRIKSRNLSGKRKIEVVMGELGLDFPALQRLSVRTNRDYYGHFTPGYAVLLELADILYHQKRRGVAIDAVARSLNLRPAQRFLLSVAALPPKQQAKRMLSYFAQPPSRDSKMDVFEYWENLGSVRRIGAFPFVKGALQRGAKGGILILVLESLTRDGDRDALALIKKLAKERSGLGRIARNRLRFLNK